MATVKIKKGRRLYIAQALSNPRCPKDFDVVDRGSNGLKFITSNSKPESVVSWWMTVLKSAYPDERMVDEGQFGRNVTMRLTTGVGVKLDKRTGELKLKGPNHWDWFTQYFDALLEHAPDPSVQKDAISDVIERQLGIQSVFVDQQLAQIPECGCIKEGPLFTYTLWKALLDSWFRQGAIVTIVTAQIDGERLADILLLMLKNRGAGFQARLYVHERCDGETRFDRIKAVGVRLVEAMRMPTTGKRMFSEEKIAWVANEMKVALQPFQTSCNFVGMSLTNDAEVYATSARFHKTHFVTKTRDFVAFHRMTLSEYAQVYLEPLGMEYLTDTLNGSCAASVLGSRSGGISRWQSLGSMSARSRSRGSSRSLHSIK